LTHSTPDWAATPKAIRPGVAGLARARATIGISASTGIAIEA
jgi:hypothetical protein